MLMPSYIEEFKHLAKLEDRRSVLRQLLVLRYGTSDEVLSEAIDLMAEMPSNEVLHLLLTRSQEELLTGLENGVNPSTLKKDLFKIIGPVEEYYIQKQGEKEALEALAKLRFGEIDETLRSAIAYLLQTPAKNSIHALYTLTRAELVAQFGKKSGKS
jgi:hypothetical protein